MWRVGLPLSSQERGQGVRPLPYNAPMSTRAIVGLGNPGMFYARTRHNLGYRVVALLAKQSSARLKTGKYNAAAARTTIEGVTTWLMQPLTMMNGSGAAVGALVTGASLQPADVLVVCDDIYLPLGTLRLRPSGGDGGHNGLSSIIEVLGTEAFPRLRMGVGQPPAGMDYPTYVLHGFAKPERAAADAMVERAAECARAWLTEDFEKVMGRYNATPNGDD